MHHNAAMTVGGCPEICALSRAQHAVRLFRITYVGSLDYIEINSGQTTFFEDFFFQLECLSCCKNLDRNFENHMKNIRDPVP